MEQFFNRLVPIGTYTRPGLKTGSSDRRINAAREKQLWFGFITTVWTEVASPGDFVVKLQPSKIDNR